MKKYIVYRHEEWVQPVSVEAESLEDAVDRVMDGEGEELKDIFEFVETRDPSTWTAMEDE